MLQTGPAFYSYHLIARAHEWKCSINTDFLHCLPLFFTFIDVSTTSLRPVVFPIWFRKL